MANSNLVFLTIQVLILTLVASVDFNRDGKLDIAATNHNGHTVSVLG